MDHDRTSGRHGSSTQPHRSAAKRATTTTSRSYTPSDQSLVAENLGTMGFVSQDRTSLTPARGMLPDYPPALTDALRRSRRPLPRSVASQVAPQNLDQSRNTFPRPLEMADNPFGGAFDYTRLDPSLRGGIAGGTAGISPTSYPGMSNPTTGNMNDDATGFGFPVGPTAPSMSPHQSLLNTDENATAFDFLNTGPDMPSFSQGGMFQFEAGSSGSNTSASSVTIPPKKATAKAKVSQPKKSLSLSKKSAPAKQQKAALTDKKAAIEAAAKAAVAIPTPAQVQTFFGSHQTGVAARSNTASGSARTSAISAAASMAPVQDPLEALMNGARDRLACIASETEYRTVTPPSGDDVGMIDESMLKTMAKTIYDNLAEEPRKAPDDWPQHIQDNYNRKQTRRLKTCQRLMATKNSTEDHMDRCLLAVGDAVRLHKRGVPVADLNMKRLNAKQDPVMITQTGIEVDKTLTCAQRVYGLAVLVMVDKNVAYELLTGKPMADNVRNPIRIIEEKLDTFHGNCVRDAHRRKGRQIELEEDAANSDPEAESDAEEPDEVDDDEIPTEAFTKRKRGAIVSPANISDTQSGPKAKRTKSKPVSDEDVVDLE